MQLTFLDVMYIVLLLLYVAAGIVLVLMYFNHRAIVRAEAMRNKQEEKQ